MVGPKKLWVFNRYWWDFNRQFHFEGENQIVRFLFAWFSDNLEKLKLLCSVSLAEAILKGFIQLSCLASDRRSFTP